MHRFDRMIRNYKRTRIDAMFQEFGLLTNFDRSIVNLSQTSLVKGAQGFMKLNFYVICSIRCGVKKVLVNKLITLELGQPLVG